MVPVGALVVVSGDFVVVSLSFEAVASAAFEVESTEFELSAGALALPKIIIHSLHANSLALLLLLNNSNTALANIVKVEQSSSID